MVNTTLNIDLLFETSWEVCNKIGGIYTVLSTKAKTLQALNKDKTIFIGPDVWTAENPSPYFVPSRTLMRDWLSKADLPAGVEVRVGRWDIPGRPIVVLVKFDAMYDVKDQFYARMWELYRVDSLHAYGDYDEACAFSHAAGAVIESICRFYGTDGKNIIAHFDEWTTGMGLLYVNERLPEVATVFTTHATCMGRSICGNGKPLYDYLRGYNGDQMAAELNMQSKHSLEKAAAHTADCFTTVSDITADECEQLLERRPLVTPNGFEQNFVPTRTRFAAARAKARKAMLRAASALTGCDMPDDTLIIATSGRCEYRNKGIDMYLDAIHRLGDSLADTSRQVLAFVMVPAWVKGPRADLQEAIAGDSRNYLPDPVITHEINNPDTDPIYRRIHSLGAGRVKTIYVPCYLNGDDGIFGLPYYDLLIGMDATVFPSYYEPWGYTPLESIAFGVPTITTSLSGFGQWILSSRENTLVGSGVKVVARGDFNYDDAATRIADELRYLVNAPAETIDKISAAARETSRKADWKHFIDYYRQAYSDAESAAHARVSQNF